MWCSVLFFCCTLEWVELKNTLCSFSLFSRHDLMFNVWSWLLVMDMVHIFQIKKNLGEFMILTQKVWSTFDMISNWGSTCIKGMWPQVWVASASLLRKLSTCKILKSVQVLCQEIYKVGNQIHVLHFIACCLCLSVTDIYCQWCQSIILFWIKMVHREIEVEHM